MVNVTLNYIKRRAAAKAAFGATEFDLPLNIRNMEGK